jgi:hypothetical protein
MARKVTGILGVLSEAKDGAQSQDKAGFAPRDGDADCR